VGGKKVIFVLHLLTKMTKKNLRQYYDSQSEKMDYWRKKNKTYHNELKRLVNFLIPSQRSVIEIGCGTGDLINSVSPSYGLGVDLSPKMIDRAKEHYPKYNFEIMDAENISTSRNFDYVILSDLIGLLSDIQVMFNQLHKISRANSRIIITYYNHLWEPILKLAEKIGLKMSQPFQNWLSRQDIENLLYLSGFEVVKSGQQILMPKYIPLLTSLCNRYLVQLPFFRRLAFVYYVVARTIPENCEKKLKEFSCSVIIPARNERGNIESAVKRMPKLGSHTEIIFVEGGSSDGTQEEIERVAIKYKHSHNIKIFTQKGKGKGDAVREGFAHAEGDILFILDADLTVMPEELTKFYEAIKSGKGEFINGARLIYPIEKQSMRFLNIIGNKFFSIMFGWLLGQRIKDTLCGTKVISSHDYKRIAEERKFFGEFDPFGDFDLLFGASKLNLKIVDLPIRYQARTYGATNIQRFKHGLILLKMCIFAMRKIKFI
jgi:ubiquinone/menaquinone biosynthesis C-methylase UbiE